MAKDDRSAINPFTNKKHLDLIDDDKFLEECYRDYYKIINQSQLLDNTKEGQLVRKIAMDLIDAVEKFLAKIGRSDYTQDYYDWEFHLIADSTVNAWCMPGGKIAMYSGMFGPVESMDDIALILGHEMAHALLDHSRTKASAQTVKNAVTTAAWIGSIGLSLFGMGELGALTRTVTNVADIGSEFLIMKPFSRDHEFEADKLGMMIMHWAGYDISGVPDFWARVSSDNPNEFDFFSTHPADSKRIDTMKELIYEIENGKDFYNVPVLGSSDEVASNKVTCPYCGKLTDKNSEFCIFCGNAINGDAFSKKKCSQCGKFIDGDAIFCTNCGYNLNSDNSLLTCNHCGKSLKENDKFCTNCGTPVKRSVCSKCGAKLKDNDKFCTNCGEKID